MKRVRLVLALLVALLLSVGLAGVQAFAEEEPSPEETPEIGRLLAVPMSAPANSDLTVKVVTLDEVSPEHRYVLLANHERCKRVFSVQPSVSEAIVDTSKVAMGEEIAIKGDIATWSIAAGEDGTYVIPSDGSYLTIADGQVFSDTETPLSITESGAGYVIANGESYVSVDYKDGHVTVPAATDKASVVFIAEVVENEEPEPEPEPLDLDTDVKVPALLSDEGFTATITTPDKVYSSYEYVIFAQNADGEYVAIDREDTASTPLSVSSVAYGKRLTSSDNDVTWRVVAHDNVDNKMVKYISNVANDLLPHSA